MIRFHFRCRAGNLPEILSRMSSRSRFQNNLIPEFCCAAILNWWTSQRRSRRIVQLIRIHNLNRDLFAADSTELQFFTL
jgi:hypothetical protein